MSYEVHSELLGLWSSSGSCLGTENWFLVFIYIKEYTEIVLDSPWARYGIVVETQGLMEVLRILGCEAS